MHKNGEAIARTKSGKKSYQTGKVNKMQCFREENSKKKQLKEKANLPSPLSPREFWWIDSFDDFVWISVSVLTAVVNIDLVNSVKVDTRQFWHSQYWRASILTLLKINAHQYWQCQNLRLSILTGDHSDTLSISTMSNLSPINIDNVKFDAR